VGAIKQLMEQLKQWEVVLKGRNSEIFSLTFEVSAPVSGDREA
jgi:hypothetical protein